MQNLNNVEIREYLKKKGVYQYVLADKMGVSESTLERSCRQMKKNVLKVSSTKS